MAKVYFRVLNISPRSIDSDHLVLREFWIDHEGPEESCTATRQESTMGAFHLTKISGLKNRNVRIVPFPLGHTSRQDLGSLFLAFELQDDSHLLGNMLEDSDEVIVLSAACCFVRRNLTRIQDYFEQNLPRYLPDEFDNSASPDVKKHAEY